MEELSRISGDELNRLYAKQDKITSLDRLRLQSFAVLPLCNRCDKLTNSEIQEIYYLENKNLFRVMNIAMVLTGKYEEGLALLKRHYLYSAIYEDTRTLPGDEKARNRVFIGVLFNLILKDFELKGNVKFYGKMPQKLFQFRQQTADQWFQEYAEIAVNVFALIYAYLGTEEALAFIFGYTAYYLNRSQTFKYHALSTDSDMNDTIYRILRLFCDNVDGNSTEKSNIKGVLYKDL